MDKLVPQKSNDEFIALSNEWPRNAYSWIVLSCKTLFTFCENSLLLLLSSEKGLKPKKKLGFNGSWGLLNPIVYPTFSKKLGSAAIVPKQDNLFETKTIKR